MYMYGVGMIMKVAVSTASLIVLKRTKHVLKCKYNGERAITSFTLSVIESKRKYTEAAAILRGKNVQWVAVGNSISCFW